MPIFKINKKLNKKVFLLIVGAVYSWAFIQAINDSIRNSTPLIKTWWFLTVLILSLIDFFTWRITGQEIIAWILEQLGIEFD